MGSTTTLWPAGMHYNLFSESTEYLSCSRRRRRKKKERRKRQHATNRNWNNRRSQLAGFCGASTIYSAPATKLLQCIHGRGRRDRWSVCGLEVQHQAKAVCPIEQRGGEYHCSIKEPYAIRPPFRRGATERVRQVLQFEYRRAVSGEEKLKLLLSAITTCTTTSRMILVEWKRTASFKTLALETWNRAKSLLGAA